MPPRFIADEFPQLIVGVVARAGKLFLLDDPELIQAAVHGAHEFHAAHDRIQIGIVGPPAVAEILEVDLGRVPGFADASVTRPVLFVRAFRIAHVNRLR